MRRDVRHRARAAGGTSTSALVTLAVALLGIGALGALGSAQGAAIAGGVRGAGTRDLFPHATVGAQAGILSALDDVAETAAASSLTQRVSRALLGSASRLALASRAGASEFMRSIRRSAADFDPDQIIFGIDVDNTLGNHSSATRTAFVDWLFEERPERLTGLELTREQLTAALDDYAPWDFSNWAQPFLSRANLSPELRERTLLFPGDYPLFHQRGVERGMYARMEPYEGAAAAMHRLADEGGVQLAYITDTLGTKWSAPNAARDRMDWLLAHDFPVLGHHVHLTHLKHHIDDVALFIDDSPNNLRRMQEAYARRRTPISLYAFHSRPEVLELAPPVQIVESWSAETVDGMLQQVERIRTERQERRARGRGERPIL